MPEFFQTIMGRKFFDHDVPELNETLNKVGIELRHSNNLKAEANRLKEKELNMKADELLLKEKELRLKERELDLMQQALMKR